MTSIVCLFAVEVTLDVLSDYLQAKELLSSDLYTQSIGCSHVHLVQQAHKVQSRDEEIRSFMVHRVPLHHLLCIASEGEHRLYHKVRKLGQSIPSSQEASHDGSIRVGVSSFQEYVLLGIMIRHSTVEIVKSPDESYFEIPRGVAIRRREVF